jgi:hypothetical protein
VYRVIASEQWLSKIFRFSSWSTSDFSAEVPYSLGSLLDSISFKESSIFDIGSLKEELVSLKVLLD